MSLTSCIKQAGSALRPADKAAILALSRTYRADGMSPDEAGKKAIAEQIAVVQKLMAKEQAKPESPKLADAAAPITWFDGVEQRTASPYKGERDDAVGKYIVKGRKEMVNGIDGLDTLVDKAGLDALIKSEDQPRTLELEAPTQQSLQEREDRKLAALKQEDRDQKARDKKLADEQTAKDNASRFAGAVENFKLGESADQNLSGQDAMFSIADKQSPTRSVWRSALRDGLAGINAKSLSGAMWTDGLKGLVNKGTAKTDEIEWSGITDWLQLQTGKVSKEQVLDYLDGNGVRVEETMLGGKVNETFEQYKARRGIEERNGNVFAHGFELNGGINRIRQEFESGTDVVDQTKYGQYQLPGGENYKELLLTLPQTNPAMIYPAELKQLPSNLSPIYDSRAPVGQQWGIVSDEGSSARPLYGKWESAEEAKAKALGAINSDRNIKAADEWRAKNTGYKSSHWDQKNILAHIRFNERISYDKRQPYGGRVFGDNFFAREMESVLPLEVVHSGVVSLAHHDEVQRSIVSALPVNVVDLLKTLNLAPKDFFTDKAVSTRAVLLGADHVVRARIVAGLGSALGNAEASLRAKLIDSLTAGLSKQLLPALDTSDLSRAEVSRLLSTNQMRGADTLKTKDAGATSGAALAGASGGSGKLSATDRTLFVDSFARAGLGAPSGSRGFVGRNAVNDSATVTRLLDAHATILAENERTDADGKRVLFIEEVQSDWAQEGKKKGFTEPTEKLTAKLVGKWNAGKDAQGKWEVFAGDQSRGYFEGNSADEVIEEANSRRVIKTPVGPFVGKTDAWVSLALKRMVSYAAENGFDKVAFVNGEQSAERYDLSKQVQSISYLKNADGTFHAAAMPIDGGQVVELGTNVTAEKLEESVGKDIAQKIVNGEGKNSGGDLTTLSGVDLKVGGEGMKAFYDKIVPTVAKDVLRKLGGGQMTTASIASDKQGWHLTPPEQTTSGKWMLKSSDYNSKGLQFNTEAEAQAALKDKQPGSTQLAFDITPAMREKASAGLPMFAIADQQSKAYTPPNGLQAAPARQQQLADQLAARLNGNLNAGRVPTVLHAVTARAGDTTDRARSLAAVAVTAKRLFGHEVVFVDLGGAPLFNGAMSKTIPGVVFIRVDSTKPHMAILGHELLHQLRASNPGLYNDLDAALTPLLKEKGASEFLDKLSAGYKRHGLKVPNNWDEELWADVAGDNFMDPEFLQALGAEQPALFKRVVDAITKFLNTVIAKLAVSDLQPFGTRQYLTDAKAAREAVAKAFREFSGTQVGAMTDQRDTVAMSIADDHSPSTVSPPDRRMRIADLPRDMREELFNEHATNLNPDATERGFYAKTVPSGLIFIKDLKIDKIPADQLQRYKDAKLADLPPIVISDGRLIDGQHRIQAAREKGYSQLRYIDVTGLIDTNAGGFVSEIPLKKSTAKPNEPTTPSMSIADKHSPEQMAKWAAEKKARYQASLQADTRQRERDKASLANQQERLSKSEMWNRFSSSEKAAVNYYDSAEDRNDEGAKQAVNAIQRALKSAGITIEKTSASNDGKSKSIYVKVGNEIVRVSDHELPATPLRQHNRATGFAGKWNREVIISDWQSTGMDEYLQEILGGAPTASRLEYESLSGAEAPNGAQSGRGNIDSSTAAPDNPDISLSIAQPGLFQPNIWSTPENSKIDTFLYNVQDGKIDLRRTQEAILKSGQTIAEQYDARLAETLYPGRVAHRSQTFLEVEAQPLLKAMHSNKVGMDELADYLHARGAEERNAQIAKVNPAMPDGGAGTNTKGTLLTTQAAKDYLTAISPTRKMVLDAMAKRVDAITAGTRTLLVTEGLEKQETIDAWTAVYKNYVPMFRDEADEGFPSHPQGSGFAVKGSASKRAMGSTKEVTNILAHVMMQREAAITRAEKNRVALALYGQALSHPNPDFWTTIKPGMKNEAIGKELETMGVNPDIAVAGMAGVPTIQTIDPNSGKVVNRPNPMYKMLPGAIPLKVNGEDRVLMLNVKNERGARLATSLKNLDGLTQLDLAGSIVGRATRFLAAVNTQYNPAFGLVNLTRDTLGGIIHLGNTELRGNALKVLAQTPVAILGIARELATGKQAGKWSKLYQQFVADGGQTGFKENFRDPNDRAKAIEKELKALGRGALSPGKYAHAALDLLEGFNTTLENAVRLSAYSAALDKGISRPQAARLARELTVDFNRKGRLGREVGPLYAFFNASVQGMARTMQAIKGPTGGKIIAGGLSLGILQALMLAAAGYDDDEIPEFVKTRALIIPLFGDKKEFISIPYPLGLHVLPNTGRVLTELVLNGGKDIGKRSVDAIGEIAGAFNPLGGGNILTADGALKTIAPTLLDPIIEVVANKNFAGSSIEKRGFGAETDNRPGVNRVRESTQRSTTGQAYMGISKAMNTATGGSDYEAGAVSPTPEMVRYLAQTVGGGVLREIEKTINASTASARGDKVKASQIPVLGRFYGEVENDDVQRSRYFKTDQEMKKLTSVSRELKKSGTDADMDAYEKKHPELEAVNDWQRAERRIAKLNKLAVETINDPKELRSIDADRAEEMRDLNQTLLDMEKATGKTTPAEEVRKAAVKAGWK